MSLFGLFEWMAATPASRALHEALWVYPVVATVHVIGLSLVVGIAAILDLRLMGLAMRRVAVSEMAERLLPFVAAGLVSMVVSGALLFYSDPVRYYPNVFLRLKLAVLILAGVNAWIFHRTVYRSVGQWGSDSVAPRRARIAGTLSMGFWVIMILAGRMIAYYDEWFACDRHPRPAIVNMLGCVSHVR
jgi:hypothetical protein